MSWPKSTFGVLAKALVSEEKPGHLHGSYIVQLGGASAFGAGKFIALVI